MKHPIDDYTPVEGGLIRHIDTVLSSQESKKNPTNAFEEYFNGSHPTLFKFGSPILKSLVALVRTFLDFFVVQTSYLIGDGVKTKPALYLARRTARWDTASNLWNAAPILPALVLMLGELGVASVPVAVGLTVGLCVIQNYLVAKLVQEFSAPKLYYKKKKVSWSTLLKSSALAAYIAINFSLSSLSFPLGIYLNSKAPLSETYAEVEVFPEIKRNAERVISLKESEIKLIQREQQCEKGLTKIVELGSKPNSTKDNGRNRLIVDFMGRTTRPPYDPTSICGKAIRDRDALNKLEAEIQAPLVAAKEAAAARALPSVTQLKEFFPEKYASLFTEKGLIRSPSTALAFSLKYSVLALGNGESGALLFPLLTLIISVALSYASMAMTIALTEDLDIRMSFDSESTHLLLAILHKEQEAILNNNNNNHNAKK